jgi:hypothetical protein
MRGGVAATVNVLETRFTGNTAGRDASMSGSTAVQEPSDGLGSDFGAVGFGGGKGSEDRWLGCGRVTCQQLLKVKFCLPR